MFETTNQYIKFIIQLCTNYNCKPPKNIPLLLFPLIVGDTNATKVAMFIGPFQEPPQAEKSAARVQNSVSTENCVTWDIN